MLCCCANKHTALFNDGVHSHAGCPVAQTGWQGKQPLLPHLKMRVRTVDITTEQWRSLNHVKPQICLDGGAPATLRKAWELDSHKPVINIRRFCKDRPTTGDGTGAWQFSGMIRTDGLTAQVRIKYYPWKVQAAPGEISRRSAATAAAAAAAAAADDDDDDVVVVVRHGAGVCMRPPALQPPLRTPAQARLCLPRRLPPWKKTAPSRRTGMVSLSVCRRGWRVRLFVPVLGLLAARA